MHIDSLNYFFQVSNCKSISTVAKNSHISQSALSQQIAKLENELNVSLFNRTNTGVTLTHEGEILLKHTESILNSYNKMKEEISNSVNNKKSIYIETIDSIGLTVLPTAISKLKKDFQSYIINIKNIDCCSNLSLINNLCDIFICYNKPENTTGITSKLIGNDKIFLVADNNFPINKVTNTEILDLPLIFTSNKSCFKNNLCNILKIDTRVLDEINILYNTNSYLSALKGISSIKAVTFIPASIYYNYNSESNLKIIDIEDLNITFPIYICYRDSFYKTNSDFINTLKKILKGYLK